MIFFLKVMAVVILATSLSVTLSALEQPFILLIPQNEVIIQTEHFRSRILIADMGDFPFQDKTAFTLHYNPDLVTVDTTLGSPESPGVKAEGYLQINKLDNSVPGLLFIDSTRVNHMEYLTIHWQAMAKGHNQFTVEPVPDNGYYSTTEAQVIILDQVPGDVDNNRSIDIIDALKVANAFVYGTTGSLNPACADVDGNDVINIVDALIIAQYYVRLIPGFPIGTPEIRQVLFINLEKEAGILDNYSFDQLGKATLTPPGTLITENNYFIFPQNSEVYVSHELLMTEIENGTQKLLFKWSKTGTIWPEEDKTAGRIRMTVDIELTAQYWTGKL